MNFYSFEDEQVSKSNSFQPVSSNLITGGHLYLLGSMNVFEKKSVDYDAREVIDVN